MNHIKNFKSFKISENYSISKYYTDKQIDDILDKINTLFPSTPIGKDKIKLGKKSIRSGSKVSIIGYGLSPLIVVSEDDINFA